MQKLDHATKLSQHHYTIKSKCRNSNNRAAAKLVIFSHLKPCLSFITNV